MINILLFAHLQEQVGESQLKVELSDVTVAQLKEWLEKHYPQLSLQQIMTAVNEEFATDTTIVQSGDTIAFIPPISGG
ncbi:molybdopterin converting factor subunit 1 [Lysinibacillus sphaericus]|uniref:Molybdopterin synthase sulfur carrier subunit n=1 Tax=Lysinibacillus sphaericus TaxID=1421 RepID=A0A2S0K2T6_LYSSH|nr:molybdopterin converting factor subunit 1 [Lysinibacillus sphaericus]AVK97656.1 molybdopterin synthase sulfur carrier subunit [Lysinibacillus sphaericus]MCS1381866.1 molybdopterin converting factor subunit 1 [Lysinibacillus sphaericus]MED4545834.1 molybdopterin converting factor subunit 1 [Lysinibacillus sphaericus]TKI17991.1 molybdopterin converting factor subunit 1 [Lysinibacillus sphaericus]SUV16426.1 molybdopterin converting factor subunit 1 [Lysinibacillus sphaericus]